MHPQRKGEGRGVKGEEMYQIRELCDYLDSFAPRQLAESWDNVGLLIGDPDQTVQRLMTCLTVTPMTVAEAIAEQVNLIVTHHPLPFRPLPRITTATTPGSLVWQLCRAGVAVYSPHTAFDSARHGINHMLAEGCGLCDVQPLLPHPTLGTSSDGTALGSGRWGRLEPAQTVAQLGQQLQRFLSITRLQLVGNPDKRVSHVATACGSGGDFLQAASDRGCDLLVTGETNFHTCLEAEARGVALLLLGHFASERFAVERLAERLQATFPQATVWASRQERDPLQWLGPAT